MKLQITLFIFLFIFSGNKVSWAQLNETACAEKNNSTIFTLSGLLTNPDLESKRMDYGINNYSVDKNKMSEESLLQKPNLPEYLQVFWEKKGVKQLTDPVLCNKISNVLDANEKNKALKTDHERVYYKVGDRYLVVHTFKQATIGPRSLPAHLVLDKDFNKIGEMEIRLKAVNRD